MELQYEIGDRVHVDADTEEWGRVASDATVVDFWRDDPSLIQLSVDSIRATITVNKSDVSPLEELHDQKLAIVNRLLENSVYMPDSGVRQTVAKALTKLSLVNLTNLELIVNIKLQDAGK